MAYKKKYLPKAGAVLIHIYGRYVIVMLLTWLRYRQVSYSEVRCVHSPRAENIVKWRLYCEFYYSLNTVSE